ncbi:asparagine synthetase B [Paenibacillus antri]|uniref:asparagine synthase (glutamine-hydrolyzing) n=1 Tax=Paenibacillus antri TaxID=2582848 RepID=A0A5R9G0T6_9BACL|nr:asparagine synthase-related protein [Paenibacillus antri]TLS49391.1 asparagine synthetase B [Paenibacillus antri]
MSAIAGIVHFHKEPVSADECIALMGALRKFPADDVQAWHGEQAFLGCHGQWITPESIGERNPYYDSERRLAIASDAILDNREELFEALGVERDRRPTTTDAQLILLAYAKWGEEAPKRLVGDFAFLIWDERERKLFGARDFSGARTLYYCGDGRRFAFCTVMQPLLSLPVMERERALDEQWLADFLAIPFTVDTVDVHSTVYRSIRQVPPSHSVTVSESGVSFRRYCLLEPKSTLRLKSNAEYEEAMRDVFDKAVRARLRTHLQVGAQLSGGLDSGSVVSFAAKALQEERKKLYTFSYVPIDRFTDWTHRSRVADETPNIRETIDYVGNIEGHFMSFKDKSSYTEIDDWLDAMEAPYKFYENSYWLKGIYEEAGRRGIGVLLTGQRGNWTISWGYALDYQASLLQRLRWSRLHREMKMYVRQMGSSRRRIVPIVSKKAFLPITNLWTPGNEDYHPKLINPGFASRTKVLDRISNERINITGKQESVYAVRRNQFRQLFYWNLNGMIGTKLSLRHRVWDRDPTNDLNVIRFCLSVPEEQFVQDGLGRSLIRRATERHLPDRIRLNQRVRGIQGADGIERMASDWKTFVGEAESMLRDPTLSEYLNMEVLEGALSRIREPKPELVFEMDFRMIMRSLIFGRFMKAHS